MIIVPAPNLSMPHKCRLINMSLIPTPPHITCCSRYCTRAPALASALCSGVPSRLTMGGSVQVVSKQKPGGAQYMSHMTWVNT